MKKMLLLAAAVSGLVSSAHAQRGSAGQWEFGAYAGYSWLDEYGAADLDDAILVGGRLGYFITRHISLEGSFHRDLSETAGGTDVNIDTTRLNLLLNFLPGKAFRPFVTAGAGWDRTGFAGTAENDYSLNGGLGARFFIGQNFNIRVDGRYHTVDIDRIQVGRQHNYEAMLGLGILFGGQKKAPEPAAPKDDDQDGVTNDNDRCPNTPAGAVVDGTGCIVKVEEKKPADADLDGVVDASDQCPNTEMGVPVDANGCPRDADGDKVADGKDRCPNTKADVEVDANGCPLVTKSRGVLKGVNFNPASAVLTANAQKVLDAVADDLKAFPEVKVEVQGHTDSTGNAATNLKLSQARAESVVQYLGSKGVDVARLTAKGYGPSVPVSDNKTKAGRELNRRVEIKWLD